MLASAATYLEPLTAGLVAQATLQRPPNVPQHPLEGAQALSSVVLGAAAPGLPEFVCGLALCGSFPPEPWASVFLRVVLASALLGLQRAPQFITNLHVVLLIWTSPLGALHCAQVQDLQGAFRSMSEDPFWALTF